MGSSPPRKRFPLEGRLFTSDMATIETGECRYGEAAAVANVVDLSAPCVDEEEEEDVEEVLLMSSALKLELTIVLVGESGSSRELGEREKGDGERLTSDIDGEGDSSMKAAKDVLKLLVVLLLFEGEGERLPPAFEGLLKFLVLEFLVLGGEFVAVAVAEEFAVEMEGK